MLARESRAPPHLSRPSSWRWSYRRLDTALIPADDARSIRGRSGPLLIWPVAVLVRRFWTPDRSAFATVALGVVSLRSGRALQLESLQSFGLPARCGLSGWKPNLALPDRRRRRLDASNVVLLARWLSFGLSWLVFAALVRGQALRPAHTGFSRIGSSTFVADPGDRDRGARWRFQRRDFSQRRLDVSPLPD